AATESKEGGSLRNAGDNTAAALATDSVALGAESAPVAADSAGLATDSAALGTESAVAPVALVEEEDQAPFPRAHSRPVETEEAGMSSATATPKDDDVAPPPSRRPSNEGRVVASSSDGAPLEEVKKAEQVGPLT
ncbi:unnamed protein product, partial [Laminaria digitata]